MQVMKNQKMTNNINSFEIPKGILITGKVLQYFSKNLAARFAARIFSTPLKFKIPEREIMMRESAKSEFFDIPSIQKKIMIYTYGFSKKKILLVHGWAGRGTQLFNLADKVLENKMMVISFDAPAHGLSTGKTTSMTEYIETILQIDKKYGPFEAAIGHSFGGMTLLNSVASGLNIKRLVTIGSDNSISEIFKYFVKKIELKPIIAIKLEDVFEKIYKSKIDNFCSDKVAKEISIPTLVIHDSEDKFVPVRSAVEIRQNLKNGELLITHGLGHHKIFRDNIIIQRIIDFIK
jgi:pimeloyl-ACP methyl ester carboxylesterase